MPCRNMGFESGLNSQTTDFKRKFRWTFSIPEISDEAISALPPSKAARPSFSFKEIEAQHLNETVYFPGKPDWKPITVSLYDIQKEGALKHPVFEWIIKLYDPAKGEFKYSCDGFKKSRATLEMLSGCGEMLERWIFENVWPQNVEFGELDMQSSEIVTCDITLRYDRAYIEYPDENGNNNALNNPAGIPRPPIRFNG